MEEIDADTISRVMQQLGSKKTEKKTQSAIDNLSAARKRLQDPDVRALLSQKQKERRERERQEKAAAGMLPVATEKRKPGRPKKQTEGDASA